MPVPILKILVFECATCCVVLAVDCTQIEEDVAYQMLATGYIAPHCTNSAFQRRHQAAQAALETLARAELQAENPVEPLETPAEPMVTPAPGT